MGFLAWEVLTEPVAAEEKANASEEQESTQTFA